MDSIGDFNGDGMDDILWRSDSGALSDWLGTSTGVFTPNDSAAFTQVSVTWQVQPMEIQWVCQRNDSPKLTS